jgi:hypothetical protein
MPIDDNIHAIELEAVRKTGDRDWHAARELFEKALTLEMPDLRQAEILRSITRTYRLGDEPKMAIVTAEQAIEKLNSAGVWAPRLRSDRYDEISVCGGNVEIPTNPFRNAVMCLSGLVAGFASGSTHFMYYLFVALVGGIFFFSDAIFLEVGVLNHWGWRVAGVKYRRFLFCVSIGFISNVVVTATH